MTPLTLVFDPDDRADRAPALSRARRATGRARSTPKRSSRTTATSTASRCRSPPSSASRAESPSAARCTASSSTCRSTPRSSPARADRQATGARDDLVRRAVRRSVRRRARDRDPARRSRPPPSPASAAIAFARPARRSSATSAASRSPGLLEVARVLPQTYAMYRRLVRHAADMASGRVRRDRLSRLQLPPGARDPAARRPGRLLHQPAALGLAPRADEDDAARSPIACW